MKFQQHGTFSMNKVYSGTGEQKGEAFSLGKINVLS